MLGEIQLRKKKMQLGLSKFVSQYLGQYYDEIQVWDEEFLKAYFNYLKETYLMLSNDNADGKHNQQIHELAQEMILISSNSFANLEFAIHLSRKNQNYMLEALEGLQAYSNGHTDDSYVKLYTFIQKRTHHINHYLINKTLGLLSIQKEKKYDAIDFITMALQKRPSDIELYEKLQQLYCELGMQEEQKIIEEIKNTLEG